MVMPEFQDFSSSCDRRNSRCETTVSANRSDRRGARWLKTIEEFVDKTAEAVIGYISRV